LKTILIATISTILFLCLAACAPQKVFFQTNTYNLKNIKTINIDGGFTIKVVTGVKHPKMVVKALNIYQPQIHYQQQGSALNVTANYSASKTDLKQIHLTLYINRLNQLQINHANSVTINSKRYTVWNKFILANITQPVTINGPLHIYRLYIIGNMNVNDKGAIALTKLYQLNGNSTITLRQLNSKIIRVVSVGHSRITLYGKAKSIYADLYQYAMLIGKHFPVKKAFIKAYGHSFANIRVSHLLFSYTTKTSRIDYLGYPQVYQRAIQASAILPIYPLK